MLAPTDPLYVDFPASFGKRVMVFVDTEEEFDWDEPKRRDATSVSAVSALPKAHATLRGFGVAPAYLIDYPVATTQASVEVLRGFLEAGECLIGSQLHPWVNPPFDERVDSFNSFPGNLPRATERAKIIALTEAITRNFGQRPIVYRAGRYGVGPNSEALLDEQGYRMDVSVRPFFDYRPEGGPQFRGMRARPYWTGDERRLLEVPLSSAFVGGLSIFGEPLFRVSEWPPLRATLSRAGLLSRVALTPEGFPLKDALKALSRMLDDGERLFSISFHSPSVEPGHTPYVRDAADLKVFYSWFDGVFDCLARNGVTPASVPEVLAAAETTR